MDATLIKLVALNTKNIACDYKTNDENNITKKACYGNDGNYAFKQLIYLNNTIINQKQIINTP